MLWDLAVYDGELHFKITCFRKSVLMMRDISEMLLSIHRLPNNNTKVISFRQDLGTRENWFDHLRVSLTI